MASGFILAFLLSFALGSIPTALWIGRMVRGIDLRDHGSGNLGATNVYRVLGARWGLLVLVLDAAKGTAAVAAAALSGAGSDQQTVTPTGSWIPLIALLGAVLGHMFSPWVRFRGGKGVATATGAWIALAPMAVALAAAVWIGLFAWRRIVSLASLGAAVALPAAVWVSGSGPPKRLFWVSLACATLVIVKHHSNLARLRRGAEAPLVGGGSAERGTSGRPR